MTNAFLNAVRNQTTRTTNGMVAHKSTGNACVDLFNSIGAMRGSNVIPAFVAAYVENPDIAVRIALWARDVRGGAGERKVFRDILDYLSVTNPDIAARVIRKIPELGRWDDIFSAKGDVRQVGFELVREALQQGNGLAAKWMPRKGEEAVELRSFLGMSPKQYRKTLVTLTKVVESQMCAKNWDEINFNHVPSLASSRYKKAFSRHTEKYKEWIAKLVKGDKTAKVNAGAVFPYDVLKGFIGSYNMSYNQDNLDHIKAQWEALPNYVGDAKVLPIIDVSGSMTARANADGKSALSCMDVSVSLGLYLADKNTGPFKDMYMTFSGTPSLEYARGNILEKVRQVVKSHWGYNTNLNKAFEKLLQVAKNGKVASEDMPQYLLILSDMQFDASRDNLSDRAIDMIRAKYAEAGYEMPKVIFWNLAARYGNNPVNFTESGVAMISGFSPALAKSVLSANLENYTPESVMLKTVLDDRYAF